MGGDGLYDNDASFAREINNMGLIYMFNINSDQQIFLEKPEQAIAYMQAQRFFVEHSFKEQKQILGMNQFQTRKRLPWHPQIALNMMVGCFILKEKLFNQDEISILSARDIMDFLHFNFYKEMTEDRLLRQLKERHIKRQYDIDYCCSKQ